MKKLFRAIRNCDLETVHHIIANRPELVNCRAKQPPKKDDGQSPLQIALKTGNTAISILLSEVYEVENHSPVVPGIEKTF